MRTVDVAPGDARCRDVNPANADPREFAYQVPCPASAAVDLSLPLFETPDGDHRLQITAEDAAGNAATLDDRTIVVDNHPAPAPIADEPPAVHGEPTTRSRLTAASGGWLRASELTYVWERSADTCEPIPGATQRSYTATDSDVGSELRVAVTATNAIGETATAASPRTRPLTAPTPPAPEQDATPAPQPVQPPASPVPGGAPGAGPPLTAPLATVVERLVFVERPPCRSQRRIVVHLRDRAGRALRTARVRLDGRPIAVIRRQGELTATIDLRGRGTGRATVRITGRTRRGTVERSVRHFVTCIRGNPAAA